MTTSLKDLYVRAGASSLVADYQRARQTLEISTKNLEQYPATPYTKENAETAEAVARLVREIGDELRAWHMLLRSDRGA